jgi:hypothetical protein
MTAVQYGVGQGLTEEQFRGEKTAGAEDASHLHPEINDGAFERNESRRKGNVELVVLLVRPGCRQVR